MLGNELIMDLVLATSGTLAYWNQERTKKLELIMDLVLG
jgi:hypothetical protein